MSILGKVGGPLDHPSLSQPEGGSEHPGGAPPPRRPGQALGFFVGSSVESRRPSVLRHSVSLLRSLRGLEGLAQPLSHLTLFPCARWGRRDFPLAAGEAEAQTHGVAGCRAPPVSAGLGIGVIGRLCKGPALEPGTVGALRAGALPQ